MFDDRQISTTDVLVVVLSVLFVLFLVLRLGIPLWNELALGPLASAGTPRLR